MFLFSWLSISGSSILVCVVCRGTLQGCSAPFESSISTINGSDFISALHPCAPGTRSCFSIMALHSLKWPLLLLNFQYLALDIPHPTVKALFGQGFRVRIYQRQKKRWRKREDDNGVEKLKILVPPQTVIQTKRKGSMCRLEFKDYLAGGNWFMSS